MTPRDLIYLKQIIKHLESWNKLFPKYFDINRKLIKIQDIKVVSIKETDYEYLAHILVYFIYQGKAIYVSLNFHGKLLVNYDFLVNEKPSEYMLELIQIEPITRHQFEETQPPKDKRGDLNFMQEQIDYPKQIYDLHKSEARYSFI